MFFLFQIQISLQAHYQQIFSRVNMSFPNATTLNAFIFVSLYRNVRFMIFWGKIKQTQNEIKWCTQKYHNKFYEAFCEGHIIKHTSKFLKSIAVAHFLFVVSKFQDLGFNLQPFLLADKKPKTLYYQNCSYLIHFKVNSTQPFQNFFQSKNIKMTNFL